MHSTERKAHSPRHPNERHNVKKKKEKCCGAHPIINSEGEIVIDFTRTSFNIAFPLPFAFWGTLYIGNNNFGAILAPYLPTGVTVTTSINQNNGNLIFSYTDGVNVDTIVLNIPQGLITYAETLESINTNYMRTNYTLLAVNAANDAPFLQNSDIFLLLNSPLIMTKVSALSNTGGSKTKDIIIPRSRMNPANTQINIVELYLRHQEIKPDTVWITNFNFLTQAEPMPISSYITVFIDESFDVNEDFEQVN